MGFDCLWEPPIVAFAKTFGPTLGIIGAAIAWLLNKFLGWCVWEGERLLERYELMKATRAEIRDNMRSEESYFELSQAQALIAHLKQNLAPRAPLVPYVAVEERNIVFDETSKSLRNCLPTSLRLSWRTTAPVRDYRASLPIFARMSFAISAGAAKSRFCSTPIARARRYAGLARSRWRGLTGKSSRNGR